MQDGEQKRPANEVAIRDTVMEQRFFHRDPTLSLENFIWASSYGPLRELNSPDNSIHMGPSLLESKTGLTLLVNNDKDYEALKAKAANKVMRGDQSQIYAYKVQASVKWDPRKKFSVEDVFCMIWFLMAGQENFQLFFPNISTKSIRAIHREKPLREVTFELKSQQSSTKFLLKNVYVTPVFTDLSDASIAGVKHQVSPKKMHLTPYSAPEIIMAAAGDIQLQNQYFLLAPCAWWSLGAVILSNHVPRVAKLLRATHQNANLSPQMRITILVYLTSELFGKRVEEIWGIIDRRYPEFAEAGKDSYLGKTTARAIARCREEYYKNVGAEMRDLLMRMMSWTPQERYWNGFPDLHLTSELFNDFRVKPDQQVIVLYEHTSSSVNLIKQ